LWKSENYKKKVTKKQDRHPRQMDECNLIKAKKIVQWQIIYAFSYIIGFQVCHSATNQAEYSWRRCFEKAII
jgi:hypothetical protein